MLSKPSRLQLSPSLIVAPTVLVDVTLATLLFSCGLLRVAEFSVIFRVIMSIKSSTVVQKYIFVFVCPKVEFGLHRSFIVRIYVNSSDYSPIN